MAIVKLYANLRQMAGKKEVEVPGRTVRGVLEALSKVNPKLGEKILDGGKLRAHFIVSVNGNNIVLADDLETEVNPEDEVAIFPPIAGGGRKNPYNACPVSTSKFQGGRMNNPKPKGKTINQEIL